MLMSFLKMFAKVLLWSHFWNLKVALNNICSSDYAVFKKKICLDVSHPQLNFTFYHQDANLPNKHSSQISAGVSSVDVNQFGFNFMTRKGATAANVTRWVVRTPSDDSGTCDGEHLMNYGTFCIKTGGSVAQSQLVGREFPFETSFIGKTRWL